MIDWDERYSEAEYAFGTDPNDFLASVIDEVPRGRVLCLCEGEGRNAVYLAQHGCEVTGVDAAETGLRKAHKLADEKGVSIKTMVSDLDSFVIEPEYWDAIVSIFCHVPQEMRLNLHQQCAAGLRHGGVFILEAYTARQIEYGTGGPQTVDRSMSLLALQSELAELEILHGVEIDRDVIEGKYHTGCGAVVQLLARKV